MILKATTNNTGLIRKNELAMKYFPNATTPKLARDNLTRWINRCKELLAALRREHLNPHDWYYTPKQVKLIYHYLGTPD